jgi:hypothetical protein
LPKASHYKGGERRATSTPMGAAARSTTATAAPAKLLPQRPTKAKEPVAAKGSDDGDWESF